jgi:hypothetical protein
MGFAAADLTSVGPFFDSGNFAIFFFTDFVSCSFEPD